MLTCGMTYDRPKMFDTNLLGVRGEQWFLSSTDWVDVQAALSCAVQASPAMVGFVYTPKSDKETSMFSVTLNSNCELWKCEIRCYAIGPFHRTLDGIEEDATIMVRFRTCACIETHEERMEVIGAVVAKAKLVAWQ